MPVSWHQVIKVNIPYLSEPFGGEDFEMNKPTLYYTILYYIFSIFVASNTFQPIAEPEKKWPENVQPNLNLIGNFQIWSAISLFHSI